jgi:hypothetical protein
LRGCRRVGRRGRAPQVGRESFRLTRRPAQQQEAPVGFGQKAGRVVEIDPVEHHGAAHVKTKFAALEAYLAPAATVERRLKRLDARRLHFVEPLLGPLAALGGEAQTFGRLLGHLRQCWQIGPQPARRMARPRQHGKSVVRLLQEMAAMRPSLLESPSEGCDVGARFR